MEKELQVKLPLKAQIVKPVQRIPRYELLIQVQGPASLHRRPVFLTTSSAGHVRIEADNRFGNAIQQIWQRFFVNIAIAEISRLSESPLARLSRLA